MRFPVITALDAVKLGVPAETPPLLPLPPTRTLPTKPFMLIDVREERITEEPERSPEVPTERLPCWTARVPVPFQTPSILRLPAPDFVIVPPPATPSDEEEANCSKLPD